MHDSQDNQAQPFLAAFAAGRAEAVAGPAPLRPISVLLQATALAAALTLAAPAPAPGQEAPPDFAAMVEAKLPAVVGILSSMPAPAAQQGPQVPPWFEDFFGQPDSMPGMPPQGQPGRRMQSQGSGFIISADGYAVTNNHVVAGAEEIEVVLGDDRRLPAELVGTDPATDLAVLKIDAGQDLPTVAWGDSETLQIGEWVVAIGNPFGLGGTVTAGILSARSRDINAGPYDDFLQTDAAINRGNSGGPLFNAAGEVIGVNTAIFSPSGGSVGIGFAVPSGVAQTVVDELRATGEVSRGWLGVQIQPVDDALATALGLEDRGGALVSEVVAGSPAEEAGVEPGDVIVSFDGSDVEVPRDLSFAVAATDTGESATVTVVRGGERQELSVDIAELPDTAAAAMPGAAPSGEPGVSSSDSALGLTVQPLGPRERDALGASDDLEGALVAAVAPDGPGAEAGVRPGDIIVEAGGTEVASPEDLQSAVEEASGDEAEDPLLLRLFRNGNYAYLAVPVDGSSEG